jgi:hypothetical protein
MKSTCMPNPCRKFFEANLVSRKYCAGQGKVVPVRARKAYVKMEVFLHSFFGVLLHTRPHYARTKKLQVFIVTCSFLASFGGWIAQLVH